MRILVDVDNVLNNLAESVINVYNEDSGDNLKIEDIHNYYIENYVKESYNKDAVLIAYGGDHVEKIVDDSFLHNDIFIGKYFSLALKKR